MEGDIQMLHMEKLFCTLYTQPLVFCYVLCRHGILSFQL